MQVIDWTPEQLGERAALLSSTMLTRPLFTSDDVTSHTASFTDSALATFERENLAWNALKAIGRVTSVDRVGEVDPNWNPYAYMRKTWDATQYKEFMPYIAEGLFEGALTPEAVELKARALQEERDLIRSAEGSLAGALVGGVGAAIADPTTYIPVGGWLQAGGAVLSVSASSLCMVRSLALSRKLASISSRISAPSVSR